MVGGSFARVLLEVRLLRVAIPSRGFFWKAQFLRFSGVVAVIIG
jgi:hypothetical protein